MFLSNDVENAYVRIKGETYYNEDDVIIKPIENPFNHSLYERIVEDLETLEADNDEFIIKSISLGPMGGVLIELIKENCKVSKYSLEYLGSDGIYWQKEVAGEYLDGCSRTIPLQIR